MHRIRPNLWLGGDHATTNELGYEELKANGITAVLNVASEVNDTCTASNTHTPLMCCKIGLHENSSDNRRLDIFAAVALLETLLYAGHIVYLHCHAGADRSPYIAAMHLSKSEMMTVDEALAAIHKIRPILVENPMYLWYGNPMGVVPINESAKQ